MNTLTKQLLFDAWQYCDDLDKSTEFMLQYMQDVADVDLDEILNFIEIESSNRYKKGVEPV